MKSSRNVVAAITIAVAAAAVAPAARAASAARRGADYFTNVVLTTHEGKTVRFFDDLIKGKIVAIDLIYTTCQYACPLETARLAQVQRALGDRMGRDVFFYSITIDPDHDTPAVLADYARKYGAGPGWLFLTGSKRDIDALSRKLGLYSPPNPANPDGHMPYLLVGNESTGQWMRNSAVDNPKFLARTIGDWLNGWATADTSRLTSSAESSPVVLDAGRYAFAYHCAACHTVGGGTRIGPDLDGVTSRRDREWLRHFIQRPDRMNADGDPIAVALRQQYQQARMPNLDLSDEDTIAVLDYLDAQSRTIRASVPSPEAAVGAPRSTTPAGTFVDAYLRIHQALQADRVDSIRGDAVAIAADAALAGSPGAAIRAAAATLGDTDTLVAARAAFGALSDRLIAFIRASNGARDPDLSIAFCPMAQKYWLQKGERIQNPYYGKAMPDCGRIVNP